MCGRPERHGCPARPRRGARPPGAAARPRRSGRALGVWLHDVAAARCLLEQPRVPTPRTRAQILGMMVEGISIRAISRMTGAGKSTAVKLLEDAGEAFTRLTNGVFKESRKRRPFCRYPHDALQFRPHSPDAPGHASDGGRCDDETVNRRAKVPPDRRPKGALAQF